jgi:acyl-coenzyme A thioesterase PaaI-like protein
MNECPPPRDFDPTDYGWRRNTSHSFLTSVADIWHGEFADGYSIGFFCEPRHDNGAGNMHGGMLTTLADVGLGRIVWRQRNDGRAPDAPRLASPTIQLDIGFMGAVRIGDFVYSRAEIARMTRSLTFARGSLYVADKAVVTMQGIFKVVQPATAE